MNEEFGTLFRRAREEAGKTLGGVARCLGISMTYLSDVERCKRPPLTPDRIIQAAAFMGYAPETLLTAAAINRGSYSLPVPDCSAGQGVAAALTRKMGSFDEEQFNRLRHLLDELEGTD